MNTHTHTHVLSLSDQSLPEDIKAMKDSSRRRVIIAGFELTHSFSFPYSLNREQCEVD